MRRVQVPELVHGSTLAGLQLKPYHLTWNAGLTRVIRGVAVHPTRTRTILVPQWADDRWLEVRQKAAALQLARPDAITSHVTAALLHGWALPLTAQREEKIHVTSRYGVDRFNEVVSHRRRDVTWIEAYGIRLTGHSETLRHIAGLLSEEELLVLLEGVCGDWHGPPSTTPEQLLTLVPDWPRFRGSLTLLRVLPQVRTGVGSPQETRLRRSIVRHGLPEPAVAHPVVLDGITFHSDLSYPDLRIALDYEGDHHRTDARQWESDIRREELFREAGWVYLRVTRSTNMLLLLDRLAQAHADRSGSRPIRD